MTNPSFRSQFSFFRAPNIPIYFDSAATTQKLTSVLESSEHFLRGQNASVHRSAYPLANQATKAFEKARADIAKLVNAPISDEVVFTSGATESLNMIAQGLRIERLSGDTIAICESEHHANILPWQALAERLNLKILVLPLGPNGQFTQDTMQKWIKLLDESVVIIACAHVSNVLGTVYPVAEICAHAKTLQALSVIDGTQAVAHLAVDVQAIDCDFYVFSGHKMYGPSGIGICWGRFSLLESLQPSKLGGEMVTSVSFDAFTSQPPPLKFEAGTPNTAGALGLGVASQFLAENIVDIALHEQHLMEYLFKQLSSIKALCLLGNWTAKRANTSAGIHKPPQIAIFSFYVENVDNHALATALYAQNIALRFGQHCAMPLFDALRIDASLRVSLGCYNDMSELDAFIDALKRAISICKTEEVSEFEVSQAKDLCTPLTKSSNDDNTVKESYEGELNDLRQANNWPEKHRQLLLLSKLLPTLAVEERIASNEVFGCEAKVWISRDASNPNKLNAYSSSKVVRGILAVLVLKYNHLASAHNEHDNTSSSKNMAHDFDYATYLQELGLSAYFSEGRKDGVHSVIGVLRGMSSSNIAI